MMDKHNIKSKINQEINNNNNNNNNNNKSILTAQKPKDQC
jgi:hypothetical protein